MSNIYWFHTLETLLHNSKAKHALMDFQNVIQIGLKIQKQNWLDLEETLIIKMPVWQIELESQEPRILKIQSMENINGKH